MGIDSGTDSRGEGEVRRGIEEGWLFGSLQNLWQLLFAECKLRKNA